MKLAKNKLLAIILAAMILVVAVLSIVLAIVLSKGKSVTFRNGDFTFTAVNREAVLTAYSGNRSAETLEVPSNAGNAKVVSIAAGVFEECSFNSIILPDTLTAIGARAFAKNTSLTTLSINGNPLMAEEVFAECSSLANVTLAESVTALGDYCFSQTAIAEIDLKNVKSFGEGCFYQCKKLTKINLGEATVVPDRCFQGCAALSSVTLSDEVTAIGDYAFTQCSQLVAGYGEDAFDLPLKLQTIGVSAFSSCNKLRELTLPSTVTEIGGGAFTNCFSGFKLNLENNNLFVQENNYILNADKTRLICATFSAISGKVIDMQTSLSTVTAIEENCFGFIQLSMIKLNSALQSIGSRALADITPTGTTQLRVEIPLQNLTFGEDVFKNNTVIAAIEGGSIQQYVASTSGLHWERLGIA